MDFNQSNSWRVFSSLNIRYEFLVNIRFYPPYELKWASNNWEIIDTAIGYGDEHMQYALKYNKITIAERCIYTNI